ncbi:MAG: sodium:proton antiporter [Lachnospiraceae bacterium]|nr:sodium:proton antiporter [Lachnospiraceae bacterium]
MSIVWNFPAISILLCLFAGIVSSGLSGKSARRLNTVLMITVLVLSAATLKYVSGLGESVVYVMGRFPAPWGNELRFGVLEAGMATFFAVIMILSMLGGHHKLSEEVESRQHNLYYVLVDLLLSSLLALIYTNDIFTAYVFVEINTIAACGLIMIRGIGRTIEAAVRYMIMSLIGSGMLLMGICILYDITGHLLMSNMKTAIAGLVVDGTYPVALLVSITLICVGLAIKSALFPFHAWLPDAYGYSTVSSAAILSSLVSKGYIFLLIKIIYRVVGFNIFNNSDIIDILFVFGLSGMIFGSVNAIRENDVRRMIAYSSVAQIGYIYMGIGMGTQFGMIAAIFHILCHAATKSLLFVSAIGLTDVSGCNRQFIYMTGSGYRHKFAGVAFTVGALSMVGVPLFAGFISKLLFAESAVSLSGSKMLPVLIVLGISTILNAIYFMKTVIRIYTPAPDSPYQAIKARTIWPYCVVLVFFIAVNLVLGCMSDGIVELIKQGLIMFG